MVLAPLAKADLFLNELIGFGAGGAEDDEVEVDTFPALSNVAARYCAGFGVTKNGSNVISLVNDLSGNARHLDTAVGSPTWAASSINSKPVFRFSGAGQCLYDTFTLAQPHQIWVVFKANTWTNTDALVVGVANDSGSHAIKQSGSTPQIKHNAGTATGNTVSPTLGTAYLIGSFFSGASSKQSLNDAAAVGPVDIGALGIDQLQIGGESDGTNCIDGDIAEVVVFSAEVTGADLTSLKSYFNTRYDLW